MSHKNIHPQSNDGGPFRRRSNVENSESHLDPEQHNQLHHPRVPRRTSQCDRQCTGPSSHPDTTRNDTLSPDTNHPFCHYPTHCLLAVHAVRGGGISARSSPSRYGEEGWHDGTTKTTIRAENEVEANREANNYKFGFRKWKSHVTERPIQDRSDIIRELYSELNTVKPQKGSVITCGNIAYVFLFGWWISLLYLLFCPLMFLTVCGAPYGRLCWKLTCYFIWPFGKSIQKSGDITKFSDSLVIPEEPPVEETKDLNVSKETTPLLVSSPVPVEVPVPQLPAKQNAPYWCRVSTYLWLLLVYPLLAVAHGLVCLISWVLVFTIPVAKMNARILGTVLLMAPEDIHIEKPRKPSRGCETRVLLCCYRAFNLYYYKYSLQGIHIFALNLLPLVLFTIVIGYADRDHKYFSSQAKFTSAISSIIPLSYFIGMGIASISAQSNFAVGAVVNATFGSFTEITFYITALLQGYNAGTKCYEEIVKAALTGTLLGCILFIPGICMVIGGIKHREQRFNSRSAGVSSALLFISVGGVFAPTVFSKTYGNFLCEGCANVTGNSSAPFTCKSCHYDTSENSRTFLLSHIEPLVYTISVVLPAAYLIGLIFTLKTHSHIYDIHISDGQGGHGHGGHHVVHWSRWRALGVLVVATMLMAACADLTTENIGPFLTGSSVSQYFIGVTVLAMVPELPEIVNGIQFALQNNISLSLEVGSCIAVQVCMIQIPLLILFNAFYDVGFMLVFGDIHLWSSIFSVILVNYIFMDGKCDYFQGTALVVVYLILLSLYFFAPSPSSC